MSNKKDIKKLTKQIGGDYVDDDWSSSGVYFQERQNLQEQLYAMRRWVIALADHLGVDLNDGCSVRNSVFCNQKETGGQQ